MSSKKLLVFGKRFFIIVGVITGILLLFLLISYVTEPDIKVSNLKITNLSDSSATISWISKDPSIGSVFVSEDNKFDILTNFKKVRFYDDRDTGTYSWVLAVNPPARYTHHVTVTNLNPESKYYYRIAGTYKTVEMSYPALETLPTLDTLQTPDPMYGTLTPLADLDSIVYVKLNSGLELSTFLNDQESFSLDKTNTRTTYKDGDKISLKLQSKDTYVEYEGVVGKDQPLDLTKIKDAGNVTGSILGVTANLVSEVKADCTCGAGSVSCGQTIVGPDGNNYKCNGDNNTEGKDPFEYQGKADPNASTQTVTNQNNTNNQNTNTTTSSNCGRMNNRDTFCNPGDSKLITCNNGKLETGDSCDNPAPYSSETALSVTADLSSATCKSVTQSGDYCGTDGNLYNCKTSGTGSLKHTCANHSCNKNAQGTADTCNGIADTTPNTCVKGREATICSGYGVFKFVFSGDKDEKGNCTFSNISGVSGCSCTADNKGYTCSDSPTTFYPNTACTEGPNYEFYINVQKCASTGTVEQSLNDKLDCKKETISDCLDGGRARLTIYSGLIVTDENGIKGKSCENTSRYIPDCTCEKGGSTCKNVTKTATNTQSNSTSTPANQTQTPAVPASTGTETKVANNDTFKITTPSDVQVSDSCYCGHANDGSILFRCGQIATSSNGSRFGCENGTVKPITSVATDGNVGIQSENKAGTKMDFNDANVNSVWNPGAGTVLVNCGGGTQGMVAKFGDTNPWTTDCPKPTCTNGTEQGCTKYKPGCTSIKNGKLDCTLKQETPGTEGVIPSDCKITDGSSCPSASLLTPVNASAVLGISTTSSVVLNDAGTYKVSGIDGYTVTTDTVKILEEKDGGVQIKFFYDINGDGIKQDSEQYVTEPLQVKVDKVTDISNLNLKLGWNLIGYTNVVTGLTTAKDLLNEITKQGGYATHVATYRNGKWVVYSMRAGVELGKNYNLIPGEAYFVRVHKEVNLVLEGKKMQTGSDYYLSTGWNLISLVPDKDMKASGLIDKINLNTLLSSDVVTRYQSGKYDNLVKDATTVYGQDFGLTSVDGYFVRLKKGGSVTSL